MNIKAIIFDFGFTLFYFRNPSVDKYFECFNAGLEKAINHLEQNDIITNSSQIKKFKTIFNKKRMNFFRKGLKNKKEYPTTFIFEHVLEVMELRGTEDINLLSNDQLNELARLYHSEEANEWVPFEKTKETLIQLSKIKGLKLAVLSNHSFHPLIVNLLKKYNLLYLFDAITTSAEYGMRKPDPGIFYYTLDKLGLKNEPESCLMCGDEHADIMGAHEIGMETILCKRMYKFPFEKEIKIRSKLEVNDISALLDAFF
ncbi:MAG: HAD-IA family hydrolase [Candidatus Lokiarchaeota archaeon]|nr:HAD-IA family hydrolase [Candidatus Lokiarchaeota archaeon]